VIEENDKYKALGKTALSMKLQSQTVAAAVPWAPLAVAVYLRLA
tara:strand:+ start:1753 stop:1884 length:132 start_codon:yes stop_codon:yes gene_type:complete